MYTCIRQTLPHVTDFKKFWKQRGPFTFALTSSGFPPVMLGPEEWIFSNDRIALVKELMQFHQRKMSFTRTDFQSPASDSFTPEDMIPWRIKPFPEAWNDLECPAFLPHGYLARSVLKEACVLTGQNEKSDQTRQELESRVLEDAALMETAFFQLIARHLSQMGYVLLSSDRKHENTDSLGRYLHEWKKDEQDAGLL